MNRRVVDVVEEVDIADQTGSGALVIRRDTVAGIMTAIIGALLLREICFVDCCPSRLCLGSLGTVYDATVLRPWGVEGGDESQV